MTIETPDTVAIDPADDAAAPEAPKARRAEQPKEGEAVFRAETPDYTHPAILAQAGR